MALPRSEGNLYFDTYDNIPSGLPEGMVVHTKGKLYPQMDWVVHMLLELVV